MRHRWSRAVRTWGSSEQTCERCGLRKIARFYGRTHWTEFQRPDGAFVAQEDPLRAKTPECVPSTQPAQVEQ